MRTRTRIVAATPALAMLFVLAGCNEDVITRPGGGLETHARPSVSVATVTDEALLILRAPEPQLGGRFGFSVAAVGQNLLVGAPGHEVDESTTGQAFLFDRHGTLLHTLQAEGALQFGYSVAGVGEYVLVGARLHRVDDRSGGQAYLFDQNGTLFRTFRPPADDHGFHFGTSVAAVGEHILVGAPLMSTPHPEGFGVIGAGRAYLFNQNGTLLQTFQAPDRHSAARFGVSVAAVGEHVLVGAHQHRVDGVPNVGQAYLFDQNGTLLQTFKSPDPKVDGQFGISLAGVGDHVLVGEINEGHLSSPGRVYLFDQNGTLLRTFQAPEEQPRDEFGISVAVVGEHVLVGASRHAIDESNVGQAYLFNQNGTLLQTFRAPVPAGAFAFSVAGVGEHVLAGAHTNPVDGLNAAGQAFLFAVVAPTPSEQIETLLETTVALELQRGIEQALSAPLNAALASVENDRPAAIQQLQAFINQAEALRGKQLTNEEADALIAAAQAIIDALEQG